MRENDGCGIFMVLSDGSGIEIRIFLSSVDLLWMNTQGEGRQKGNKKIGDVM